MCYNSLTIIKGFSLRLCYLYSNESSYPSIDTLLNTFNTSKVDINTTQTVDNYDVYIIDLHDADKNISKKIIDMFADKVHVLVYFIIPKKYTLLLFQLAFRLNAKSIITQSQNVYKLIDKIKADEKALVHANFEKWLGHIKINTQKFLVYKHENPVYINDTVLSLFSCDTEEIFKAQILPQIDTQTLLSSDTKVLVELVDALHQNKTYELRSLTVSESDKLLYIDVSSEVEDSNNFLSNKFSFIEVLKEKILEKNISESNISLLTISIENSHQLSDKYGIVDFESQLFNFISYMNTLLNDTIIFAQFEHDFYVLLFENIPNEELSTVGHSFYTQVLNYIQTKNSKILLDLFIFNLDNKELSEILSTLSEMESKKLVLTQKTKSYIQHLTGGNGAKDILESAFANKIKFKILNIYHGLVINTSSKILKVTQDTIYITFESLQGIVLKNEKKTVLQSDYFSNDIYADVKQINLNKKIVVLENFKFLKTNANSRKYARVTPSIKIPIAINTKKNVLHGVILDLSIKSIAIQIKHQSHSELDKLTPVTLVFNLLNKSSEDGYIQLSINATITLMSDVDNKGQHKVVCDLAQDTHDIDIVLKYVYERQKELIIELKKMSKLN